MLEHLRRFARAGAIKLLASRGLSIVRDADLVRGTMLGAVRACARRGHAFGTIIDVGASDGRWSGDAMQTFGSSAYLLVEAQPGHEPALRRFVAEHPNASFVLAAAGDKLGEIHFDAADPFAGVASRTPKGGADIVVPMTTIDHEVASRSLRGPFLLKLDTHGFELPILAGAARTLEQTEVVIVECYGMRLAPEALTFDEMCAHMRGLGFRCIDMVDPVWRPRDGALWQMDLVFVRADRAEFEDRAYG